MAGVFLDPKISPLMAARIESLLETFEDEEDIREGLKALEEGDEGSVTLEELERRRVESSVRV